MTRPTRRRTQQREERVRPDARANSVDIPQLDPGCLVRGGMGRRHLTSSLVSIAVSTTLFAGIAWGANLNGTDHRDFITGTQDADVIDTYGGLDVVRAR